MSIYDRRLETEINNIIKKNLANGYVPTASEVIGELSRYLSTNNLSIPTYKYKQIKKNFTASTLDSAKEDTTQDLDILFASLIELYQLADEQITKFSTEKKKFDYKLSKLESKLTSLINKYSTDGYTLGFRENFSDMEGINLTDSSADIDIINREATLKRLKDAPYRDFTVSVNSGDLIMSQNGDINDCINKDGITWQGIIERNTQEETSITITIDVGSIVNINRIELDMPVLKKCDIAISSSTDGDEWNAEFEGKVSALCAANFSNSFRYIQVILSKIEADKQKLGKYQYYFIVDNIKLDTVRYSMESDMISKPIGIGSNINKVSLSVDAVMPTSTSIDYYVAAKSDDPTWIAISPEEATNKVNPTVIAFNTIETDQRLSIQISDEISNDAYEMKNYSVNGQHLYAIAEIDNTEITAHKLYKGMNAWKVESLAMTANGTQTHSVFISNPSIITTKYVPISDDKPGLILNNQQIATNAIMNYSTTICREAGDTVYKEIVAASHPITVYLNGVILYSGTPSSGTTITYPFKKGSNLLEVIINVNGTPAACSADLNLSLFSIGSIICANKAPMKSVSLFDLRYNTNNQYNAYTLYYVDGKYKVIVKDPNLAIRYDLVYDYAVVPVEEIIVKATLRREQSTVDTTPRLLAYEVKFV